MEPEFLTVRLSGSDARVMRRLRETTGLSKTEIVKRALRLLRSGGMADAGGEGLFSLGSGRFGRHGDIQRQSSEIKRVARSRADAKRTGR